MIADCDKDLRGSSVAGKRRRRGPVLLAFWMAFIFGTSCTVVRPGEFFRLIAGLTGAGPESMEQFAVFWGVSWFTIVKGWHVTEFAILTVLSVSVLTRFRGTTSTGSIIVAMLLCIAFAASDEWHQSYVPDRFGTVQDVLIDCLGICIAGGLMLKRLRRLNAHRAAESGT